MSKNRSSGWYVESIDKFLRAEPDAVVGKLAGASPFEVVPAQAEAWLVEVQILQRALSDVSGWISLEFEVPRLGSRLDAVVLTAGAVIALEFKVGESKFHRQDYEQVWDYALDLKNFHAASRYAPIFPVLVATASVRGDAEWATAPKDGVRAPYCCNATSVAKAISAAVEFAVGQPELGREWFSSQYNPTPTIVEAAKALFARHTVEDISRSDAGARNLAITSKALEDVIAEARAQSHKAIAFVTGVPGAGKTLVGLSIAASHWRKEEPTHAVFLSGNGPLVAVLREALTRDELDRRKAQGKKARKGEVAQEVKPFIQNVHHFRDAGVRSQETGEPPVDKVAIFDEAQRAWTLEKTADFMKRKKGVANFRYSEPQFLIDYMNRHKDWAVVVCLVGGGQEINTGEAGISTWLEAVAQHFPDWRVYVSRELRDSEYGALSIMDQLPGVTHVVSNPDLHLSVSMRSFRSEKLSAFVSAALNVEIERARSLCSEVCKTYPLALTRDIDVARKWTRDRARGSERYGLVASSQAQRLKPYAVDVRVNVDPVHWFLADRDDTRSSWYLEDPATEYQVQGLELDWVCMTWDADLRMMGNSWLYREFKSSKWQVIRKEERKRYLLNAYRVLMTRARQGMVIFVPKGDPADSTRKAEYYDETFEYLKGLGIPVVA